MNSILKSVVVIALLVSTFANASEVNNENVITLFDKIMSEYPVLKDNITTSDSLSSEPFDCDTSKVYEKSKSVHTLRPSDIEYISAFGDSLTAANGAKALTLIGVLTEYRGVSWSIGGDKDLDKVLTFPNVFKKFNPEIEGYSLKTGKKDSPNAHLNAAIPGAKSFGMLKQAKTLVEKFKAIPGSDDKWKMVTLFIGGNDLCQYCLNRETSTASNYTHSIQLALDYLHDNLPKTFVNFVLTMNVINVVDLGRSYCPLTHEVMCPCSMKKENAKELNDLTAEYQRLTNELVASGRYDTNDQFTVVVHKFMTKMTIPRTNSNKPDYSLFAPDCFHFSEKGHEAAALELWNNLFIPVQEKPVYWKHMNQKISCPTEETPYFFTNINSKSAATKVKKSPKLSDLINKF